MNLSCIAKTKYPFCYFSVLLEQKWLYYSPVYIVPIFFETNISTQSSISTASTRLSSRIVFLFQEANAHRINCSSFRLGATFSLLGNCWSVKAWTFVVRVARRVLLTHPTCFQSAALCRRKSTQQCTWTHSLGTRIYLTLNIRSIRLSHLHLNPDPNFPEVQQTFKACVLNWALKLSWLIRSYTI